jgi:putative tricarboxylic transport membrane protein
MSRMVAALVLALAIGVHGASGVLTIVAPAAPGGGWDQTARVMQQVLARVEPDGSVQVENVPGAAGTIGLSRFVSSERGSPDALLVTGLVMVSAIITNHSPVSLADTTPIARLTGEWEVIVVPANSRLQTLADLLAAFKASPASIAWGGGSAGGTDDLLVRLIAQAVGIPPNKANYIAFAGGGAALAALLGGQVAAGVSGYAEFAGQIHAGTLRLLAVSAPARVAGIDGPTLREQGVALDLANWRGLVAPPGLTEIERERLTARVERMAASAEWKAVLARNGWSDLLLTGPAFRQFMIAEQQRIEQVLRSLESANTSRATGLRLTPSTLPSLTLVMGSGLIVISAYRAIRSSRRKTLRTHPVPFAGTQSRKTHPAPFWLLALLATHALAMPAIGFVPASAVLFSITAWLLGSARWLRDGCTGIAIAGALYLAFTLGLGLDLPGDPLTRWLAR